MDTVIGDMDYSIALSKLDNYKLDEAADSILIRGLSLDELEDLVKTESKGVNKIEDKELKEWIANNAINLLEKDKDYSEVASHGSTPTIDERQRSQSRCVRAVQ